jgi:hypothetical protein
MKYATTYQENKTFHMKSFTGEALLLPKVTEVKWESVNGTPYPVVHTSESLTEEELLALNSLFDEHDPSIGDAQDAQDARIAALKADGEKSHACCIDVLAVITGYNKSIPLTEAQVLQLITDFADINLRLRNDMPSAAKPLVQALEVIGVVTQQLKDDILRVFAQHGY